MAKKARRIIVECKNVNRLKRNHIAKTIKKYQYPYFADRVDIIIPERTEVPSETRAFSKESKVKIRRVRYW